MVPGPSRAEATAWPGHVIAPGANQKSQLPAEAVESGWVTLAGAT
jgi:hypothetical protein